MRVKQTKADLHVMRKIWHALGGIAMVVAYGIYNVPHSTFSAFMGLVFSAFFVMEVGRKYSPSLNDSVLKYWGPFMRQHEVNQLSGSFFYVLGSFLVILLFPKPIAILSILYLALGDPAASAVGLLTKRTIPILVNSGKSLLGTFAGFLICSAITYQVLDTLPIGLRTQVSIVGGIIGSLTELSCPSIFAYDDNIVIPVLSAIGLQVYFNFVGLDANYIQVLK